MIILLKSVNFLETSLKVGTVVEAEEVPKSKNFLKLQIDLGEESPRQVVAGNWKSFILLMI